VRKPYAWNERLLNGFPLWGAISSCSCGAAVTMAVRLNPLWWVVTAVGLAGAIVNLRLDAAYFGRLQRRNVWIAAGSLMVGLGPVGTGWIEVRWRLLVIFGVVPLPLGLAVHFRARRRGRDSGD
jgi:hypothetical protein